MFWGVLRYLLVQLGFHPVALVLILAHKEARTVICIRRKNTDHRTYKIASITNKIIKQKIGRLITT